MKSDIMMLKMLSGVYWFDDALQTALTKAGFPTVSRAQSMLFANIGAGEQRATRLAANLGVTRQAIAQMITELEERGILKVTVDPMDRRARIVSFTEASTPLRFAAEDVLRQLEKELRRRIGDVHMTALVAALSKPWGEPPEVTVAPRFARNAGAIPPLSGSAKKKAPRRSTAKGQR